MRECKFCHKPLSKIHPGLIWALQWGHQSLQEAQECPLPEGVRWPVPEEYPQEVAHKPSSVL